MSSTKNLLLAALILAPFAATAEDAKAPKVTFSGMVDSYYTLNLTQGQATSVVTNGLTADTGFNLNFAKLTTVAELDPVTFRLDVGLAKEGALIGSAIVDPNTGIGYPTFVQQAYASMKFKSFTLDAGRFVTPAGFEVFEAKDNWLYTKGLIFSYALPTAHEGVRVAVPLTEQLTLTGYVANGSDLFTNDVGSTHSPYKTGILNLVFAKDATTAAGTVFFTKDPATGQNGYLLDVVFTQGMGNLSFNLSGDYGNFSSNNGIPSYSWFAVGASAKLQLDEKLKVVGRVEYLDDADGARTGLAPAGVSGINFFSVTAGCGYAVGSNAELRAELRLDKASEKVYAEAFDKDTAVTAHLAAIAWF